VAIVTPVNTGKGPTLGYQGNSDAHRAATCEGRAPSRRSSNSRRRGALDEAAPIHSRERSDTRRQDTTRKHSPSRGQCREGVGHVEL
jgi:hypothetical protein